MRLFGAIEKFDANDDGTLIVSGCASSTSVDSDGETVSAQAMKDALPEYMKFANLREMHQPIAAGKTILAEVLEDGRTFIKAHVVDAGSVAKVKAGVLKGFSIGADSVKRATDNAKLIIKLALKEISLCDRPSNPEAVFDVWKADKPVPEPDKGKFMIQLDSKTLAKALGLPDNATDTDLSGALLKRLSPSEPTPPAIDPQTPPSPRLDEIQKAIDGAMKPLMEKMSDLEKREKESSETLLKAEKAQVVAQASAEGKVIPLSDEDIEKTPVAILKAMVSKLEKKVILAGPRAIRPLDNASQETLRKSVNGSSERAANMHNEFFRKQFYPSAN
jgi:hypothetical protein